LATTKRTLETTNSNNIMTNCNNVFLENFLNITNCAESMVGQYGWAWFFRWVV